MIKFLRAIKIAFQYMYRNAGLSFASVVVMALSFFIVSVVGLAAYVSRTLVEYVNAKPSLVIFLKGDLSEEKKNQFIKIINDTSLAREVSLKDLDYTKDDFSKNFPDLDLQGYLQSDDTKSYMPILTFVYGNSQDDLKLLIQNLSENETFIKELVDPINTNRVNWYAFDFKQADIITELNQVISFAGLSITIFLFTISSILIFITIKLTINYHKKELEIMDLVGADGWFIRLPFIVGGMIYGLLGGIISTSAIFLLRFYIMSNSINFVSHIADFFGNVTWPTIDSKLIFEIYFITIIIGMCVGTISSTLAIIRYVRR